MDKFDQIIDDYKKKKLGEAKEARKSAIEMIEEIEDEALLELMYKYMKRVIDEEKEKKNG